MRRPGHPVRHDHQRVAHVSGHGPDPRLQPVLRVHVPQRHRVQPGLAQPHEVRRGRRRVRCRGLPVRGQGDDHRPGDPGRQRLLPDPADRGEQPQVPAARPGLRQPRRAADVPRSGLRLRRGSQLRGRADRDHARRGVSPVGRDRARPRRPVLLLRREPRAVPAGHRQAPRRRLPDPDQRRPDPRCSRPPRPSSTRRSSSAPSRAIATPRSPSLPRPAPSPS